MATAEVQAKYNEPNADAQTWPVVLVQQAYPADTAASHFLHGVEPLVEVVRPQSATSNDNIGGPARLKGSNSDANPLSMEEAYTRLGVNQIRLLRLFGGPQTDTLSVSIFQTDLGDPQAYEALSYVVGSSPPTAELHLRLGSGDIARLQITPHLENILKTLRYPNKDRVLWVDALSIAQTDEVEKAEQIQNVGSIFQNATNVCVWLGPETEETNAAMEFVRHALDFNEMDVTFANTKDAQKRWVSLAKLMLVPYFSRRWIVQEVAFAKKATVHCGSKMVDWPDLADAAVLLETHWPILVSQLSREERDQLGDIHAPGAMSLVQLTSRSLQKDHDGRVQARLIGIESLVTLLPMFDTTLQHDTIYSILSLARDTYQGKSLRVDYTLDPAELFAEVVQMIIAATGNLDIICRPWAPSVRFAQPSWIGRSNRYPFFRAGNGQYDRRNADSLVGLPERRIYNASRDTPCHSSFQFNAYIDSPKRWSLKVRGFEIGSISTAYEKSQHGSIPDAWLRFRRPAYEMTVSAYGVSEWASPSVAAGIRQTRVREVLWRILFADRTKDGQSAPHWYIRACHHCLNRPGEHWGEQAVNIEKLVNRSPEKLKEVLGRIRETIWNRKLFQYRHTDLLAIRPDKPATAAGLFSLGLGPGHLREDDVVVVLFGCSVPLILRKISNPARSSSPASSQNVSPQVDSYELVGEAYVYGMMDGEALEKKDDGTYLRTEKEFEIF